MGKDYTIFSKVEGIVVYSKKKDQSKVRIACLAAAAAAATAAATGAQGAALAVTVSPAARAKTLDR
jgi:hypothetical protein